MQVPMTAADRHIGRVGVLMTLAVLLIATGGGCGRQAQNGASEAAARDTASAIAQPLPEMTVASLDQALASGAPVLLEFGRLDCPTCKEMQAILLDVRKRYPTLFVGLVYVEHAEELLDAWKVQLLPTQILIGPDRKEIVRHVGLWEFSEIAAVLDANGVASH